MPFPLATRISSAPRAKERSATVRTVVSSMRTKFGGVSGGGWRAWRTAAEELASVLLGPCRDVGRVALDPLPEIGAGPLNRLASVGCGRFVRFLLEGNNGARPA